MKVLSLARHTRGRALIIASPRDPELVKCAENGADDRV